MRMSVLICKSCEKSTTMLIGKECPECNYKNQPINQTILCTKCWKILGYYRKFDECEEPNRIDKVFCSNCQ